MSELWTVSLPILLVDMANPVLLAAVIISVTQSRPMLSAISLILGHTAAYLLSGALIIYGLADLLADQLSPILERWSQPQPGDYVFGLVLGIALIWIGLRWRIKPPKADAPEDSMKDAGLVGTFFLGAVINFIGAPFALPYFAFINQLLKLDEAQILPNLLIYNFLYTLPFLLVPLSVALIGPAAMPVLQRINETVEKYSAYILPTIFLIGGVVLMVDAVLYLVTGLGLI